MKSSVIYNQKWIAQRADPYVYRHTDGLYYFTASIPSYDCIFLRRSETLAGLAQAEEHVIWRKHDSGPQSIHVWAPELHYVQGRWYVYYSAGDKDDIWAIRPYVLECLGQDPIADPWIERGKIQRAEHDDFSFESFSLDATVFQLGERWYYIWSEKVGVGKQIANLYIARMRTPYQLDTPQVLISSPSYDWERVGFWVNEGPAVLFHGDRLFLTYSASETGVDYCMGMLSCKVTDDPIDPAVWKKERYPVLRTDEALQIYGPGHNCFTKDEAGQDIMIFHARTEREIVGNPLYNPNRHAMVMPLRYDEKDWPIFSYQNGREDEQ
ncbi:MAG: family 43 glycosylhydrolase [Clostridiales bacterium]|nr:family 43 glycosylhydrolase [Clostridiales bacterium]